VAWRSGSGTHSDADPSFPGAKLAGYFRFYISAEFMYRGIRWEAPSKWGRLYCPRCGCPDHLELYCPDLACALCSCTDHWTVKCPYATNTGNATVTSRQVRSFIRWGFFRRSKPRHCRCCSLFTTNASGDAEPIDWYTCSLCYAACCLRAAPWRCGEKHPPELGFYCIRCPQHGYNHVGRPVDDACY
jgi:hypothetical protein